jgi:hypothetical protein
MPVVTKYATAVQAAGGVYNGSWTGAVSTVQSDNAVYATAAPGKNQEYASVFEVPFTTGEVPSGATINSALVEIQVKCSTTASVGIVTSSLFADSAQATAIGAVPGVQTPATEPTVDTTFSFTRNPTEAQIRDLWVRVQGTRGNSNTALTWSLDFVRVTVNYTDPPTPITGSGGTSFGFSQSGSGAVALPSSAGAGGVAYSFATSGSGAVTAPGISGSGGVTFTAASTGTGTFTAPAISGDGAVTFGFGLEAAGATVVPTFAGDGGVSFAFTTSGDGSAVVPGLDASGDATFGFSLAGAGTVSVPSYDGIGGASFTFATGGEGTTSVPALDATGNVEFGFGTTGSGSVVLPQGTAAGGVTFGFALDGAGAFISAPVSGSGGSAFPFTLDGAGAFSAAAIVGSGGVEFDFGLTGASVQGPGNASVVVLTSASAASVILVGDATISVEAIND